MQLLTTSKCYNYHFKRGENWDNLVVNVKNISTHTASSFPHTAFTSSRVDCVPCALVLE